MTNFKELSQLEIEEIAADQLGLPASEEEVSELFDEEIVPTMWEGISRTDFRQAFSVWIDHRHEEGTLSIYQWQQYCYCGKHREWMDSKE